MASKTFMVGEYTYVREKPQGRIPQGLVKWNGYLDAKDLLALEKEAARLAPYVNISQMVRAAVGNYVRTELLIP